MESFFGSFSAALVRAHCRDKLRVPKLLVQVEHEEDPRHWVRADEGLEAAEHLPNRTNEDGRCAKGEGKIRGADLERTSKMCTAVGERVKCQMIVRRIH